MGSGNYDISEKLLKQLSLQSINRDLLDELVRISRKNFNFFSKQTSRAFEYVWLISQMEDVKDKKILDVGAGVSPLPIYFANMGAKVYTVDSSNIYRDIRKSKKNWNGWGYVDYNIIHKNIISFNLNINEIDFDINTFDYIYSISVIEHMPASERKLLWDKFYNWCNDNGSLLLTIDLYRGTDDLWNYFSGKAIESIEDHGNIDSVVRETKSYFSLKKKEIIRDIINLNNVDIAELKLDVKK